jgi:hypothetical protein
VENVSPTPLQTFWQHIQKEGWKKTFQKSTARVLTKFNYIPSAFRKREETKNIVDLVWEKCQDPSIRGLYLINAAHAFEELFNQRTINFAKYLANQSYMVVYIRWQWDYIESDHRDFTEPYANIVQIPLYAWLTNTDLFEKWNDLSKEKGFICTFPAPILYNSFAALKDKGYKLYYDIMDEWEEFNRTGQAPWYVLEVEKQYIRVSDVVTAVSVPLKEKFQDIKDIKVVGNGYNPEISKHQDIACKQEKEDKKIHVGYFGHMTESWFDWDSIFRLAEQSDIEIHLIGHGMSDDTLEKMKSYSNIHFYGKVHPSKLHEYVKEWHIGLIPFQTMPLSKAVDPIKIYEYIFFGLETVSTGIPHIGAYPTVTHVENPNDIVPVVREVYQKIIHHETDEKEREQFLQETTWDRRFAQIIS